MVQTISGSFRQRHFQITKDLSIVAHHLHCKFLKLRGCPEEKTLSVFLGDFAPRFSLARAFRTQPARSRPSLPADCIPSADGGFRSEQHQRKGIG
jgi:hypothetical protein